MVRNNYSSRIVTWGIIFLVGCIPYTNKNVTPTELNPLMNPDQITATSFATITNTRINTTFPTPTIMMPSAESPTMQSKLSPADSEAYIMKLIKNNNGCKTPCFLGIIPGETTDNEAMDFNNYLGWKGKWFGSIFYSGTQLSNGLEIDIGWTLNEKKIDGLYGEIRGENFRKYADKFSFKNQLSFYGKPSEIRIDFTDIGGLFGLPAFGSYTFEVFYEDTSLLLRYSGIGKLNDKAYQVCPTDPYRWKGRNGETYDIVMDIGINGSNITMDDLLNKFETHKSGRSTLLSEVTSIDEESFYSSILKSDDYCINIPYARWK